MNRTEHQVPGFGGVNRRHKSFFVTQLADENDIGIFANRVFHADAKINDIDADFALIDQAFVIV